MLLDRKPVNLFCSFAEEDERFCSDLEGHLTLLCKQGYIQTWHAGKMKAGAPRDERIAENLNRAELILLLISSDFYNDCYDVELRRALERHRAGEAYVIPVLVRSCLYEEEVYADLEILPRNKVPIDAWKKPDAAYTEIAKRVRQLAQPGEIQRLTRQLRNSMNQMESSRFEPEAASALAKEPAADLRELVRLNSGRPMNRVLHAARSILAVHDDDYTAVRRLTPSAIVQQAQRDARVAMRGSSGDGWGDTDIELLLSRADAEYGLGNWKQAIKEYKAISKLLPKNLEGADQLNRDLVGQKLAVCHFQYFLELYRSGNWIWKLWSLRHFQGLKTAILEYCGPPREEPVVRFDWGGALRRNGTPRPWNKGVYVSGEGCVVETVHGAGGAAVRLRANQASFALSTITNLSVKDYPRLSWQWTADQLPPRGDVRIDAADDQAINLVITFLDVAGAWRHLYYSWDSNAPVGTIHRRRLLPIPLVNIEYRYSVKECGAARVGQWLHVQADLLDDISRIYPDAPAPDRVIMVSAQTNSQHTKCIAQGGMGSVVFSRAT